MPFPPALDQQPDETDAAYAQRLRMENTALVNALSTVAEKVASWKFREPSPLGHWAETCRQSQAEHDLRAEEAVDKINARRSKP